MVIYGDVRQERVDVTTTSSVVAAQQILPSKRKVLYLRNTSTNAADIITLSFEGQAAEANKGIVLKQNDQYVETTSEGFECWQGNITAICETANGKLTVLER
jgi:hypothetical protein